MQTGVLQRPERVILLIVGLLFGWMRTRLWILAIFTNVTAIQRMVEVYTQAQARATRSHAPAWVAIG